MMEEAVMQEVYSYFSRHHNRVAQFIANRTIMDLYLAAKRIPDPRITKRWWEKDGADVEGMRTAA